MPGAVVFASGLLTVALLTRLSPNALLDTEPVHCSSKQTLLVK